MASSLTWLDHDSAARERSHRLLEMFQESDTRDELGISAIRDAIVSAYALGAAHEREQCDRLREGIARIQAERSVERAEWEETCKRVAQHEQSAYERGRREERESENTN